MTSRGQARPPEPEGAGEGRAVRQQSEVQAPVLQPSVPGGRGWGPGWVGTGRSWWEGGALGGKGLSCFSAWSLTFPSVSYMKRMMRASWPTGAVLDHSQTVNVEIGKGAVHTRSRAAIRPQPSLPLLHVAPSQHRQLRSRQERTAFLTDTNATLRLPGVLRQPGSDPGLPFRVPRCSVQSCVDSNMS